MQLLLCVRLICNSHMADSHSKSVLECSFCLSESLPVTKGLPVAEVMNSIDTLVQVTEGTGNIRVRVDPAGDRGE